MDAAKYSAIELLRDGRRIEIRALKPEDRMTGWHEYIERTSDAARYSDSATGSPRGRSPTGTMMCAYGVPFHMT